MPDNTNDMFDVLPPCYTQECQPTGFYNLSDMINGFIASVVIAISFCFLFSYMVVFVVTEREPHQDARHQQLVSGMRASSYWLANFTYDALTAVPLVLITVLVTSQNVVFREAAQVCAVAGTLVAFVPAQALLTYVLSWRYTDHSKAQVGVTIFNLMTGVSLGILSYVLEFVPVKISELVSCDLSVCWMTVGEFHSHYLVNLFNIFPGHALLNSLLTIARSPCQADMACYFQPLIPVPSSDIGNPSDDWQRPGQHPASGGKRPNEMYFLLLEMLVFALMLYWKELPSGALGRKGQLITRVALTGGVAGAAIAVFVLGRHVGGQAHTPLCLPPAASSWGLSQQQFCSVAPHLIPKQGEG